MPVASRRGSGASDAAGPALPTERQANAIPVHYPDDEREIHRLLTRFAELRRKKTHLTPGRRATDLVTLLLKKRLFSSPGAFAHTVQVYLDTLKRRTRAATPTEDEINKRGRCRYCYRSRWWPLRRKTCAVCETLAVAMMQPFSIVTAWLADVCLPIHGADSRLHRNSPFHPAARTASRNEFPNVA